MSKKESTSEKIVRMYKEGKSFEEIATELGMPKDNVPKILEKHMPDYASYTPQSSDKADKNDKKKKKGFGGIFGKKEKPVSEPPKAEPSQEPKKEEPKPARNSKKPTQPTVNLAMNESGFTDSVAKGIAHMLRQGKSVEFILAFFPDRTEEDINAVRECMDEHFKRIEAEETAENEKKAQANINGSYSLTGLEGGGKIKQPRYNAPENKDELSDEMPSIDPVSLDELDKQIEAMGQNKTTVSDSEEEVPEMESVSLFSDDSANEESVEETTDTEETVTETQEPQEEETPASIFDEPVEETAENTSLFGEESETKAEETASVFETETKAEVEKATLFETLSEMISEDNEKTDDTEEEEISFTLDEEDDSMSPMEKMKKFAEQQISINEKKIEELKSKKEGILNSATGIDSEIIENETALTDLQKKIQDNANESASVKTRLEELEREIEEQKSKLSELETESENIAKETDALNAKSEELKSRKENIQKDASAVDEEIAEIEKENKEFAEYC